MFSERLSQYIEPATIVTVIIGALYLIGWFFVLGYYSRLNIYSLFFEFTLLYYLKMAFLPIYISGLFLAISLFGIFNNTILSAFRRNLIFFLFGILMIVFGIREDISFIVPLSLLFLLILIVMSIKKFTIVDTFWNINFASKMFVLMSIFIIIMTFSGFLGDQTAQNRIESNNIITFHWKGDIPNEIEGKELVLITILDENYYVVERQSPANKHPEVYLISKDQIEFATLKDLK